MSEKRKLAVILFADIAGYTALMQEDEQAALAALKRFKGTMEYHALRNKGRVVQYFGDGALLTFDSPLNALACAEAMQKDFRAQPQVPVRMGMHLGDVLFQNDNVFGDGVNVASRIESMGIPGAILLSKAIRDQVKNKAGYQLKSLGPFEFKNVQEPVEVFALANEGFPVPKAGSLSGKQKEKRQKKGMALWIRGLMGLLVLLGLIIWYQWSTNPATSLAHEKKSIAVLPFKDLSPGGDQEYFSDGMFDEIRNHLYQIDGLRIASRTSSMRYKDITHKTLAEVGHDLKVNHVLEGSVRKQGNNLRITVTLVDVETDSDLWSHSYDRELNDVFEIQSDIAKHIGRVLKTEISPQAKAAFPAPPTLNSKAYDLYLKGKSFTENYLHSSNEQDFKTAIKLLEEVIHIDANFASAYVEMGFAFLWKENVAKSSFRNIIKNDFLLTAEEKFSAPELVSDTLLVLSNKAISLNPKLSRAYQLRAWAHWDRDEVQKAIEDCQQAILLDPDDELGYKFLGLIHMTTGAYEQAFLDYSRCFELSIYFRPIDYADVGQLYLHVGELEKAKAYFGKSLEVLPNFYWGFNTLSWLHAVQGDFEKAAYYSNQGIAQFPDKSENYIIHAYVLALAKKFDVAKAFLQKGLGMMDDKLEITKGIEGAYIFWMNGDRAEATNRFQKQIQYALQNIEVGTNYGLKRAPYDLAAAHAFLGNTEEAFKWLKHYSASGFTGGLEIYILVDPHFQNLRKDPKFLDILKTEEAKKSKIRTRIKDLELQHGSLLM